MIIKRFFMAMALTAMVALASVAQDNGVLNHLGAGIGVGTNGISVELATPITRYVALRAGVSVMPGITFQSDADFTYDVTHPATGEKLSYDGTARLKGDLGRVQGQVVFNIYPAPTVPVYVALGGYFGGDKLVKITGSSPELSRPEAQVIIGNHKIPVDANGNISGGFKVNGFRPYLGLGWGRAIPQKE